jgi:iron(III) transport system ATP-binding protein
LGAVIAVTKGEGGWRLAGTDIRLPEPPIANPRRVLIPSRDVRPGEGPLNLRGQARLSVFRGDGHFTTLRIGPAEAGFDLSFVAPARVAIGAAIALHIDPAALRWFAD